MRTRAINRARRAFTLIEILIVVVILGILAAIVIPQFTDASEDASMSSVKSQLQTIRSQIELYRVKNNGTLPSFANWNDLTSGDYLQQDPTNPFTGTVTITTAAPTAATTQGWYWDGSDLWATDPDQKEADADFVWSF